MTAITLSNINKRFGEKVLFRDYSLHIEAGEFVAIRGESGAGKTTLLNIIGLLETPDSGSVTLCGARNPSFSSRAAVHLRRHKLSYLFQNYGLVDTDTVEANMKLATRFGKAKGKAEKERIADALAQVGLSGYERRKVYTLSGGEQQRVALAKIIAKSPDIILADEPILVAVEVTAVALHGHEQRPSEVLLIELTVKERDLCRGSDGQRVQEGAVGHKEFPLLFRGGHGIIDIKKAPSF